MYRLNIGLDTSTLIMMLDFTSLESPEIMRVINQHRVILSKKIIEYYSANITGGLKVALQSYIAAITNSASRSTFLIDSEGYNGFNELCYLVSREPYAVLVGKCENKAIKWKNIINVVNPETILRNENNNPLARFTFPVSNYKAFRHDECMFYVQWFTDLFTDQDTFNVIDKYIMTEHGMDIFTHYYLQCIPTGSDIRIFCEEGDDEYTYDRINKEFIKPEYNKWNINVYFCENMHDRYIETNNLRIAIGKGLDFLDRGGFLKKDCNINITKTDSKLEKPYYIEHVFGFETSNR